MATAAATKKPVLGRKRDETRDGDIIEAALAILADKGFDTMTMDMVAARAGAGKATLYRRWPSKPELVRDALISMSRGSVDLDHVPDTGNLKDDLLAVLKPYSNEHGEWKFRVLSGLGSFQASHPKLASEVLDAVYGRWSAMNRKLMERAQQRGEISKKADIDMACEIIVSLTAARVTTLTKAFDKVYYAKLIDRILLPAMKA